MCLTIKFNAKTKYYIDKPSDIAKRFKKIAEKDIHVVKLLRKFDDGLRTPYRDHPIEINELQKSPFSYVVVSDYWPGLFELDIERGLHSLKNYKAAQRYNNGYRYFSAIIPKGSVYFEKESTGEICSNQLIITGPYFKKKK